MRVTPKIKRRIQLQNVLFILVFLGAIGSIAWLSVKYHVEVDLTANQRHTLSVASLTTLDKMNHPVSIKIFISEANMQVKRDYLALLSSYQSYKPDITVEFIDPKTEPGLAREMGIGGNGEMLLEYEGRSERVTPPLNEQNITNTFYRLVRNADRWLVFLQGHDERNFRGTADYDFANFSRLMEKKGLKVRSVNLMSAMQVPDNTSLLIIADPRNELLAGEVQAIQDFIDNHGNVLWLLEPGSLKGMEPIAEQLGIEALPGVLVDLESQQLGDPRFIVLPDYPSHAITQNFTVGTLFAAVRGLEFSGDSEWDEAIFLESLPRTWLETDESGEIRLDLGQDIVGPIAMGVSLSRMRTVLGDDDDSDLMVAEQDDLAQAAAAQEINEPDIGGLLEERRADNDQQRIVVIGDADFLSDAYLGVSGNLNLALNLVNWLVNDDALIAIPAKTTLDGSLELSRTWQFIIGISFLLVVPATFLAIGVLVWLKRRQR